VRSRNHCQSFDLRHLCETIPTGDSQQDDTCHKLFSFDSTSLLADASSSLLADGHHYQHHHRCCRREVAEIHKLFNVIIKRFSHQSRANYPISQNNSNSGSNIRQLNSH